MATKTKKKPTKQKAPTLAEVEPTPNMQTLLQPPLSKSFNGPDDGDTRHSLVAWWGETMAILNEIGYTAHRVAKQLQPGGTLEGLMNADELDLFASSMEEYATDLSNNPPRPGVELPDPLESTGPNG